MVDHSPNRIGLEIRKFSLIFALEYEDPHSPTAGILGPDLVVPERPNYRNRNYTF